MKIYANQLEQQLSKGLTSCYMIFGDEPFQIDDSRKKIKQTAKNNGIEEIIRFVDDDLFDWQQLIDECQAMSLFATRKLIELELTSNKLPKASADALKTINDSLSLDTILVLFGPKLDANQTRSAWFKNLDKQGLYIPVYDIDGHHLQRWLQQELSQRQMTMANDAQQYLLEFTAGNLLATAQELEKLQMANPTAMIDKPQVINLVSNQSRFSVFQLQDALWAGNQQKCLSILNQLKAAELEPNIILWALQKDLLLIHELAQSKAHNISEQTTFERHKVWKNKQTNYTNAARKIPIAILTKAVNYLAQIDKAIKFHTSPCPYSLFAHVCLLLTGAEQLANIELPLALEI